MAALPLARHEWHGDWNYTLRPEAYPHVPVASPDPFDQPSPDMVWLCHPTVTGLPATEWDTLITTMTTLHHEQREAELDKRRGHRPRQARPGAGRRPGLTLADRLLATVLHRRHAPPQIAIAALFGVRPETINRRIRDTQNLLEQAGHTVTPAEQPLATLEDLYNLASTAGITIPTRTTTASR